MAKYLRSCGVIFDEVMLDGPVDVHQNYIGLNWEKAFQRKVVKPLIKDRATIDPQTLVGHMRMTLPDYFPEDSDE